MIPSCGNNKQCHISSIRYKYKLPEDEGKKCIRYQFTLTYGDELMINQLLIYCYFILKTKHVHFFFQISSVNKSKIQHSHLETRY